MSDDLLYDPKVEKLLSEYSESRVELKKYMTDVDYMRSKVEQIFPNDSDYRNKFAMEEKIKTMSSFFSMLLNIRQEFNKSLKEEIELRRKLFAADNISGAGSETDIRSAAEAIEEAIKNGDLTVEDIFGNGDDKEE